MPPQTPAMIRSERLLRSGGLSGRSIALPPLVGRTHPTYPQPRDPPPAHPFDADEEIPDAGPIVHVAPLYVTSALFGLAQGGIVPAYAVIIRELFPPQEAGVRVGTVLMATVLGMALGGWMSGAIHDLTGSYDAAFLNGILWNLLNLGIAGALLRRSAAPAVEPT